MQDSRCKILLPPGARSKEQGAGNRVLPLYTLYTLYTFYTF